MILLISHGNHRTGAPISLLNFARILKNNGYELLILTKIDGELTEDFSKLGEVMIWDVPWYYEPNPFRRIFNRIFRNSTHRKKRILQNIRKSKIKLVINNTITNGDILNALSSLNLKIITWVHEMEVVIKIFDIQPNNLVKDTFRYSGFYLAASQAVKDNLVKNHHIASDSVYIIYEIIDDGVKNSVNPIPDDILKHKKPGDFLIGGCGQNGWRKGTDLFLQIAQYLKSNYPDIPFKFIWIGGNPSHGSFIEFEEEINMLGLKNTVTIVPSNDRVFSYYQLLDLYLLTSREDPFPLAMLEAGNCGLPILGFKKSGGVEELIEESYLVEFANFKQMAEKIIELYCHPKELIENGKLNREVCSRFQPSNKANEVIEVINSHI